MDNFRRWGLNVSGAIAALTVAAGGSADVLAQWDFNEQSLLTSGGVLGSTASIETVGGVGGASFASGAGSSDPTQPGFGWQTSGYPAQGGGHALGGIQFSVSTVGYEGISVSWDLRPSNTASRWAMLLYSLDGGLSYEEGDTFEATAGSVWFNFGQDLSTIAGAADNELMVFRVVSVFGPAGFGFEAAQPGSTYSGGTWRFDMVTVSGNAIAVPAPAALGLLAIAGLARDRRRLRG